VVVGGFFRVELVLVPTGDALPQPLVERKIGVAQLVGRRNRMPPAAGALLAPIGSLNRPGFDGDSSVR